MIIFRNKKFSIPRPGKFLKTNINPNVNNISANSPNQLGINRSQEVSARNMQIEQMKVQRQQLSQQSQRQNLNIKAEMYKRRALMQKQRMEAKKDLYENRDRLKIKQMENKENEANTSLYKTKPKLIEPVPMND